MKRSFIVTLEMPPGVGVREMRHYIEDAVASWKGSLDPGGIDREGDPLFDLDGDSVKVVQKIKAAKPKLPKAFVER